MDGNSPDGQSPDGQVDIHAPFTKAERFQQLTGIDQVRSILRPFLCPSIPL